MECVASAFVCQFFFLFQLIGIDNKLSELLCMMFTVHYHFNDMHICVRVHLCVSTCVCICIFCLSFYCLIRVRSFNVLSNILVISFSLIMSFHQWTSHNYTTKPFNDLIFLSFWIDFALLQNFSVNVEIESKYTYLIENEF